jgi:hypothetical protein
MKHALLVFGVFLVVCCQREAEVADESQAAEKRTALVTINYQGEDMSMERFREIRAEEHAKYQIWLKEEALRRKAQLNEALDGSDFERITRAFVVKKDKSEQITIAQELFGKMPSRHLLVDFLDSEATPGFYLAGTIRSRSRFEQYTVIEPPFSFPMSDDQEHFYLVDEDDRMSVEEFLNRLGRLNGLGNNNNCRTRRSRASRGSGENRGQANRFDIEGGVTLRPWHAYTPPLQATFPARSPRALPRASDNRALEGSEFQVQRVDARPC